MGGYDPYSSSKGVRRVRDCGLPQLLLSSGHIDEHGVAVATARAGNVIGGGDWATDRSFQTFSAPS